MIKVHCKVTCLLRLVLTSHILCPDLIRVITGGPRHPVSYHYRWSTSSSIVSLQVVHVIQYTPDSYTKGKVLATSRHSLLQQGIVGLNQAPCLRALLQRLPLLLQEQYIYEKVCICSSCSSFRFSPRSTGMNLVTLLLLLLFHPSLLLALSISLACPPAVPLNAVLPS